MTGLLISQMLFLFLCMVIGFVLNRTHVLTQDTDLVESRILIYVCTPALIIQSFQKYGTPENLVNNADAILINAGLIAVSVLIATFLAPLFTKNPYDRGVYRYALAFPNTGFMGNAMVLGVLGEEMLFRYLVFTIPTTLFIYAVAINWMRPLPKRSSFKALLNPNVFALVCGIILGVFQIPLPLFIQKTVDACAACYSPFAMLLTGFVIGKFDLRELVKRKKTYIVSLLRLVVIPCLIYLVAAKLIRIPYERLPLVMFAVCMPIGLGTVVYPAAYGQDESIGASMAVISNVLGLVTIPLLLTLFL